MLKNAAPEKSRRVHDDNVPVLCHSNESDGPVMDPQNASGLFQNAPEFMTIIFRLFPVVTHLFGLAPFRKYTAICIMYFLNLPLVIIRSNGKTTA